MKLGFFGGSFNPPHNGHKKIIENCIDYFDKLLIIPNKNSPHKVKNYSVDSLHRIKMLDLLIAKYKVEIDLFEINSKNDISYTYNTVKYLQEKYNDCSLTMILGEDQLFDLRKWYNYQYIIKNIDIFCFKRIKNNVVESNEVELKNFIKKDLSKFNNNLKIFNYNCPISSSIIRNEIKSKKIVSKNMISAEVLSYINSNNLYK
tara:strand:+ start:139 stop:747 length:609 start_codon:yes stop_codon:yes gene_type:complete